MALLNDGWQIRATSLGTPVSATPTNAIDMSKSVAANIDFEILTGYTGPASIEYWAYPPLAGSNGCLPDMANGVLITEGALCDITGATIVGDTTVFYPAPATGVAPTAQNNVPGDHVWGRPRCMPDGYKFLSVVGASGDFAHISAIGVNSRLKAS
jgi:hypothetical protein